MLKSKSLIFWDFDGVIKDSVDVKTKAFEQLFLPYGEDIASMVRKHHEANGGMSRFVKIPLYLNWAGMAVTPALVENFCRSFSVSVLQAVVDSPWVPGVREYLINNCDRQYFVLVTATPQDEIQAITSALGLTHCFKEIYGAPTNKATAIEMVLAKQNCEPEHALMVGDSESDLQAAQALAIPFLLRRTHLNQPLQSTFSGFMFDHLSNE